MDEQAENSQPGVEKEPNDIRLTSPRSMGGLISQRGYGLQANYALSSLPEWLNDGARTHTFRAMLVEGSGDVDVLFVDEHGSARRLFIQIKNYKVSAREFVTIVKEQFYRMAKSDPHTYDRYWLVADGLSRRLIQLENKLQRLRGTGGFFDDAVSETVNQTIQDIGQSLPAEISRSEDLVDFIARRVRLDTRITEAKDEKRVRYRFVSYLVAERGLSRAAATACYFSLAEIVRTGAGREIKRREIEQVIDQYHQLGVPPRTEHGTHTGPRVAARIPSGSLHLYHHEWSPIKQSLRSMRGTLADAERLCEVLDQVLALLEEARSPLSATRSWTSWRGQIENQISGLAALRFSNDVVSAVHRRAMNALVKELVSAAERLCRGRNWEGAGFVAHLALTLDPSSGVAVEVQKLAQSNFDEVQKALERMYASAGRALESGRVEHAEQILVSILMKDPYYRKAELLLGQMKRSTR